MAFIQLSDNSSTPTREVRLYIDTRFKGRADPAAAPTAGTPDVLALNNLAVADATTDSRPRLTFEDGSTLTIADTAEPTTAADLWWLSPWL